MKRRAFLKKGIGATIAASVVPVVNGNSETKSISHFNIGADNSEIVVIGSGVFGVWTAFYLQEQGAKVTLIDAYGPGNSRASSGGESRIIRADYGERLMYSKLNIRAYDLWSKWQNEWSADFLYNTGRLTLGDADMKKSALEAKNRLEKLNVVSEVLDQNELKYRWPQINYEDIETGLFFEGGAGGSSVMARESCRIVAKRFIENGGKYITAQAKPGNNKNGNLQEIILNNQDKLAADKYIFACGPWMAKVFPEIFESRLKVFRRDVLFIGPSSGDSLYSYPNLPVWTFTGGGDERYYGFPDLRGRGLKVAPWPDYNTIDMDHDERLLNPMEIKKVHEFVNRRFPGLKNQPITESRVCQLTFSSDEHFIIDQHPEMDNTWFVCAGSGHGFKHGPALGEYVANRIFGGTILPEYDEAFKLK